MQKKELITIYREGLKLFQNGHTKMALQKLQSLPPIAEIPFYCGIMQLDLGLLNEACKSLEYFIVHNNKATSHNIEISLLELIKLKANLGDLPSALKYIHRLLTNHHTPAVTYLHWIAIAPLIYKWQLSDIVFQGLCNTTFSQAEYHDLDLTLLHLHYLDLPANTIANIHKLWGDLNQTSNYFKNFNQHKSDNTNIHIGYLSPDFRQHSVGLFLKEIISNHSKDFDITLFSLKTYNDELSIWFQKHFKVIDISNLSPKDAALTIYNHQLNILIECAGHTQNNGLEICKLKPAPKIITAWGYPNTTGLKEIDFRLSDTLVDLPDAQNLYSEILIRMPKHIFLPFIPFKKPPNTINLKQQLNIPEDCYIIGSFNNIAKLNPKLIALWNQILQNNPKVHLIISSRNFKLEDTKQRLLKDLSVNINKNRITILPGEKDIMRHRQNIIACEFCLDTYPYNGTTTTCEILAMGVPVLTLQGDTHVKRTSSAFLHSFNLTDCITTTKQQYLSQADLFIKNGTSYLKDKINNHLKTINNKNWTTEFEILLKNLL